MPPITDSSSTIADIAQGLRAERDDLAARIAVIDNKLVAISVLLDEEPANSISASNQTMQSVPQTWAEAVEKTLVDVKGGLRIKDISERLENSYAEKLMRNPNHIYNVIPQLERRGLLVRKEGKIYLRKTLDLIEKGKIEEEVASEEVGNGMPQKILAVLSQYKSGLTARGVMKVLREIPEVNERLERNPQLAYAALSRMAGNATIIRDHNTYRLPSAPAGPLLFDGGDAVS